MAHQSKTQATKNNGIKTPPTMGYNPHFLSIPIPLPVSTRPPDALLDYKHFSVAMNAHRRMTQFTAVNIDAKKYKALKDEIPSRSEIGADKWILDSRFGKEVQLPKSFYEHNDFDLGHMVRREDPLWGDTREEALAANMDTFYLTNATPQHKDFNRNAERWKGLEDFALRNARAHDLRITVFTGCIFRDDDRHLGEVKIPGQFFKVIVMLKENGELSATGYIVQQDDLIKNITTRGLDEEEFTFAQFKTYQVPLTKIEAATGLKFGLNPHDPLQKTHTRGLESDTPIAVDDYEHIVF